MKLHMLEVEINSEGDKLVYLHPLDDKGETNGGRRIAGPKAWGGSRNIARLNVSSEELVRYIKDHAPDVVEALKIDNKKDMELMRIKLSFITHHLKDGKNRTSKTLQQQCKMFDQWLDYLEQPGH